MPTTVSWMPPASGDWSAAADWSAGVVPNGASFDVLLPTAASPYRVSILGGEAFTVDTVSIGADARLTNAGTLTLSGGTSTVLAGGLLDGGAAGGAFVSGGATLLNQGTIAADVAGTPLFLFDSHAGLTVTNAGEMLATAGAQLLVETPHFTNFANHVLTGGSYVAAGNGSVLGFWGSSAATAAFNIDAASVTLDGAGSEIETSANGVGSFSRIESMLGTIAASGSLHLLDARSYTAGVAMTVDGLLDLEGGTYTGNLTIAAGGRISGFGTIASTVTDTGGIEASGGILTLNTAFGGGGVVVDAGATLALHGAVANPTDNGVISASGGTLVVTGPAGGTGGFFVQSNATLELVSADAPVAFNGGGGTLRLDAPGSFASTIFGYGTGDKLYLAGIHADAATGTNAGLNVSLAGSEVDHLNLDGDYTGDRFSVAYDGTGSLITATGSAPAALDFEYEGQLWTSHTLTWSFASSTYSGDPAFSNFITDPTQQAVVELALQKWAAVSGLSFVEEPDSAIAAGAADLRIGWGSFASGGEIGQANYSFTTGGNAIDADAIVRLQDPAVDPLIPGTGGVLTYQGTSTTMYQVALHEIGHALGLAHSTDPHAVMFPNAGLANGDLDASDIAGIQALYGGAQSCFLRGTRIATPGGEVAVEALRPGDAVLTHDGAMLAVRWIGHRRAHAKGHFSPEQVLPIRIRRDAFGSGRPRSDLWVSPDHAIFTDGLLIAARLLVNGASIRPDPLIEHPHYFHVELSRHAILLAHGLAAESYLDTGNRADFANAEGPVTLRPDFARIDRAAASCAPFTTDPVLVAPIWHRLAGAVGVRWTAPVTDDPAPRLLVGGRVLPPIATSQGLTFALPPGLRSAALLCRTARPSDARPWLDDRRCLGLCVERITVRTDADMLELPLDGPGLGAGWWPAQRVGATLCRWTMAEAVLKLPPGALALTIRAVGGENLPARETRAAA